MKTCIYINFPGKKRLYAWTAFESRPPLHTFIVFPTNHSEVRGFLSAMVTDTTTYLENNPADDYYVIDLQPYFQIDMETFLKDQTSVGRFAWARVTEDPT
jgi:hypothetical protein